MAETPSYSRPDDWVGVKPSRSKSAGKGMGYLAPLEKERPGTWLKDLSNNNHSQENDVVITSSPNGENDAHQDDHLSTEKAETTATATISIEAEAPPRPPPATPTQDEHNIKKQLMRRRKYEEQDDWLGGY